MIFCQTTTNRTSLTPNPATDSFENGTILIYNWELTKRKEDKATPIELFMIYNHPDITTDYGYYGYPLYQHQYQYNTSTDKSYRINLHGSFYIYPQQHQKPLPFGHPNSLHLVYQQDYLQDGLICEPFKPDIVNMDKIQVLFPFIIQQAKQKFFGNKSKKNLRILKHSNFTDAFKQYPPLPENEYDYLCLAIPDIIKQELNEIDICKPLLTNTTNIINDAINHVNEQYQSLNAIKFNKIKVIDLKKDQKKNRRPVTNLRKPQKKKQKKQ